MDKKKILLLVNTNRDIDCKITKMVINYLKDKNTELYSENNISSLFGNVKEYNGEDIFLCIIIGGDGTMMSYVQKYKEHNFNIFGINAGRIGCIYDGTVDNYKEKLNLILKGEYFIEKRNTIKCTLKFKDKEPIEHISFNEITLNRGNYSRLLHINLMINGIHNTPFYADGVLVATTTGSTAYNLSCNGPLLLPEAKNFVITPLCPQSRLVTSLIVNDSDIIDINISNMRIDRNNEGSKPVVFIDGCNRYEIDENTKLILTKSNYSLNIIRTDKNSSLYEPVIKVSQSTTDL
ncbi:MAG: NAD(+)/NADH kinase [Gammaproteobacteria bacterium]|nr:NAD(+)/NADH kinase [Gammaproteobacteria bacterium]